MLKKGLLVSTLFLSSFASQNITLSWLNEKPKSVAKDFYIYRYLSQDITSNQALEALSGVKYLGNSILYRFAKKYKDKDFKYYINCMKMATSKIIHKEDYCIEAGLSVYDATKLTKTQLNKVIKKVDNSYPALAKKLEVLSSASPFQQLLLSDTDTFFETFNEAGGYYRKTIFNQFFPKQFIKKIKKDKRFYQTIKLIVTNIGMTKAQKSLLHLSSEGLDFTSTFHLAINAIRYDKIKLSLNYLEDAYKKAYYQSDKDNILFWQYKLTNDKKYLKTLANSWDVNLYTLIANEELKQKQKNIYYTIKQQNKKSSYNISDPFSWLPILNKSRNIGDKGYKHYQDIFSSSDTLGHLAFLSERYHRYKRSYYITPYKEYFQGIKPKRKALLYAIARQESRFIPSSISPAYAMGMMQIMPFLSKAIAKELKESYDIDKQLEPKTNIRYANHHINYLERKLKHPLFIAYGYNGGIGYTTRTIKQGLFKKGKYEPYLSMELLKYDETKKYGKKVLANYFIYHNYLNNDQIKLSTLINQINNNAIF